MSTEDEKLQFRSGRVEFSPGQPVRLIPDEIQTASNLSEHQSASVKSLAIFLRAYLQAARELLKDKYKNIKDQAPQHLAKSSSVIAVLCKDGIIIRYEVPKGGNESQQQETIKVGTSDETISQLAPKISENVVFCYPSKDFISLVPQNGIEIVLSKTTPSNREEILYKARIGYDIVLDNPTIHASEPLSRPRPILSLINSFEFQLFGEIKNAGDSIEKGKPFLTRSKMRLPVGWDCLEIFPQTDISEWKTEYVKVWAENDLLASVVATQFHDEQLRNLDPNAAARTASQILLTKFKDLLDSEPEREEILQTFLRETPRLLCSAHVRMKPKLKIGERVTDFVFQEANGEYILVELEPSISPLFIKSGDTSAELKHAQNQLLDWRRYIEDNLRTVQSELDLPGISANPRGLIVMGRSSSLSPENRRKLISLGNENPKTKIMTYDDLLDDSKAVLENLFGPLWLVSGTTEVYYLPI